MFIQHKLSAMEQLTLLGLLPLLVAQVSGFMVQPNAAFPRSAATTCAGRSRLFSPRHANLHASASSIRMHAMQDDSAAENSLVDLLTSASHTSESSQCDSGGLKKGDKDVTHASEAVSRTIGNTLIKSIASEPDDLGLHILGQDGAQFPLSWEASDVASMCALGAQMFAAASSSGFVDTNVEELAKFVCFFLAQAGSLAWTLWIVGKLNFVQSMVDRRVAGARLRDAGSRGGAEDAKDRMGKVWNVRRKSKDNVLFGHVEWRGPEFYLNSMKLLLSSSLVSLVFGASLFSEHLGALNFVVALSLAPSIFAIAQTPTILNMYKCASAANSAPHAPPSPTARTRRHESGSNVVQRVAQDLASAVRVASNQVTKDVNWATVGAATAMFAMVAMQAAAYHTHNDMLTATLTHARHDLMHHQWVRDAMIVVGAVEEMPVVLRDNIENMFPRVRPIIKISPVVSHVLRVCSAMQFLG